MNIVKRWLVWTIALMALFAGPSVADDVVLSIDLADPRIFELVEPLRRSCIAEQLRRGASRDEAIELVRSCLERRLLMAAEFERVVHVYYPAEISPAELESCTREVHEPESLLTCARTKIADSNVPVK